MSPTEGATAEVEKQPTTYVIHKQQLRQDEVAQKPAADEGTK